MFKAILQKELRLLFRSNASFVSMIVLTLAFIMIFHFSLEVEGDLSANEISGLKWAIIFILSFVFIGQSNWEEREAGAFQINSLFLPGQIHYLTKSFLLWIVLSFFEVLLLLFFAFFFKNFDMTLASLGKHLLFLVPGTLSLVLLGNMLSSMSFATRLKEVILPLLLIPFSFPILLFGLEAERNFTGLGEGKFYSSLGIMLAFVVFYSRSFGRPRAPSKTGHRRRPTISALTLS
ncbi:MAG: heme exporter protein CcmB, partial [Spirochaetota bacterium]